MDPLVEGDLVERARNGDSEAFDLLCKPCAPHLQALVPRLIPEYLQRRVSVADILQDAYLTAFRRLGDFEHRGDGAFRAWLTQIVRNKVREVTRRYAGTAKRGAVAEVTRGARPETAAFVGGGPSPSQVAVAGELRDRVRAAVATLPPDYQEVLRLRQGEHLSLDETAQRMQRTKDSVKKLYARALDRLAEVLKE
jgi:RNA polymerase sigma-70 factor (ECF subfamily)